MLFSRRLRSCLLSAASLWLAVFVFYSRAPLRAAGLTEVVFNFAGAPANPIGELTSGPDGTLFGTTSTGGGLGLGTIFKLGANGKPQTVLEFTGNGLKNKGASPTAGLAQCSDGNLYGTTTRGGALNLGTVFQMTPDGVLTTVAEFTGAGDTFRGSLPYAGLVDGGDGYAYGTTSRGGESNNGTIFRISLTDQSFETRVEFTGKTGGAKGAMPLSALVLASDTSLFGVTSQGGTSGNGTIFSLTTDGVFTTLVNFGGTASKNKGSAPYAALVEGSVGKFYGTTARGGAGDYGTVFSVTTAGELTTLAEFTGKAGAGKGAQPEAPLVASLDGTLYGTTYAGGAANEGTIFKLTAAGKVETLWEFTGKTGDKLGALPLGGLFLSQGKFYGTTFRGGAGDAGTLFSMTPAGALTTLAAFPAQDLATFAQPGVILGSDGKIYGVSSTTGVLGQGSVFRITFTGEFTTLAEFTGQGAVNRGSAPLAPLVEGTNAYYGTTSTGGAANLGTIFKITPSGALTTLIEFTGNANTDKGAKPRAALVPDGAGNFYGTTAEGGAANLGTLFELKADGTLATLVEFTGNGAADKGATPLGALLRATDGTLYGTTSRGGAHDLGTIFSRTSAGVFTTLVEFADGVGGPAGAYPDSALILGHDGNFYGTTASGGATGDGTIFRLTSAGVLTTLVELTGHRATNKGSFPETSLIQESDDNFYGVTAYGGTVSEGTAFKMTPAGVLTTLAELSYTNATKEGAYPKAPFFLGSDGNIYTTTTGGGTWGAGTVFRLRLRTATLKQEALNLLPGSAQLVARMRTGLLGGVVRFDYGTDTTYGTRTMFGTGFIGSATSDFTVSDRITGLQPNTTYHYRTVLTDSSGTVFGPDATFTTEPLSTAVLVGGTTPSGEPDTTLIKSFGIPSIADNGAIAVVANLTTASGNDSVILAGQPAVIAVRKTPVPGAGPAAAFKSFSDPACDGTGKIAFAAKFADGARAGAGLWTNTTGTMQPVALVGDTIADLNARLTAITSYAMGATGTVFYAANYTLKSTGAVGTGLWAFDASGNHLLLHTGKVTDTLNVASIAALTPVAGSAGQGRGYRDDLLAARIVLKDKTQAIVEHSATAAPNIVAMTPLRLSIHPPFSFAKSLGIPSLGANGYSAFRGVITDGRPVIIANSAVTDYAPIIRGGEDAPGIDGASFSTFGDPVFNQQLITAFSATIAGSGVSGKNKTGLWQTAADGSVSLVARAGDEPFDVPGAVWSSFTSLALPDNGSSLFLAKLAAGPAEAGLPSGVGATNNLGLWGIDSTGVLRLLVRTGDALDVGGTSKTLSLLTILGAVPGSPGQARSYNNAGDLLYRATFTDHTQAIMRLHIP